MRVNNDSFFKRFRCMFYAVSPNETSFKDVADVPLYIDEAAEFFFIFIVLEWAIYLYKNDKKFRLNDAITSVSAGIFSTFPRTFGRAIHMITYIWIYEHFIIINLPWDSAWTWWLCFLGMDLGYYVFHRLAHEVNFMWAAHQVHHSSEDYNFSTALRQSILQAYTSWVFYVPMALFVPPSIFMIHHELNILYQFWIHTQLIKSLGPLEYILNTPSHHRVHHGRNPYCIDKNYAGTLIIWDRIFGTFQAEDEEVVYGLTHPLNTFEAVDVQFGYLRYLVSRIKELPGFSNKLRCAFYGPGWSPGKPRLGENEDIPKVKAPVEKYDPSIPLWVNFYIGVHFALVIAYVDSVLPHKEMLSQSVAVAYILYILLSLSCFGRLFNKKNSGILMEFSRCVVFMMADFYLQRIGFYNNPGSFVLTILRAVHLVSMLIWGSQSWRLLGHKTMLTSGKDD